MSIDDVPIFYRRLPRRELHAIVECVIDDDAAIHLIHPGTVTVMCGWRGNARRTFRRFNRAPCSICWAALSALQRPRRIAIDHAIPVTDLTAIRAGLAWPDPEGIE